MLTGKLLLTTSFAIASWEIIVLSKQDLCKTHLVWFEQFLEVTSIFIERWVFVIDCHQMQQSVGIKLGLKLGLKHDLHTICSKIRSPSGWVFSIDVSLLPFSHFEKNLWSFLLTLISLHDIVYNTMLHFFVVSLNSNDSKASSVIGTSPRLVSEPKKAHFIIWILKPGTDSIIPNRLIYLTVPC